MLYNDSEPKQRIMMYSSSHCISQLLRNKNQTTPESWRAYIAPPPPMFTKQAFTHPHIHFHSLWRMPQRREQTPGLCCSHFVGISFLETAMGQAQDSGWCRRSPEVLSVRQWEESVSKDTSYVKLGRKGKEGPVEPWLQADSICWVPSGLVW